MDWRMALAVFFLVGLGLTAIYSISLSQEGDGLVFLKKQLIAFFCGLLVAVVLAWSNYRWIKSYAVVLYIFSVLLLLAVLFFGQTIRGTTGWFSFFGFHFQPIEFAKISLIAILASYFSSRREVEKKWRHLLNSGILMGLPVFLTLLQPDLGSALLLIFVWVVSLFFSGFSWRYFLSFFVLASIIFVLAWSFFFADYQKERLLSFINPTNNLSDQGYNVHQAIIAIGSGGWWGSGLGFGSQNQLKFVPESQTDFIFAVIAEEFGFLGVLLILAAFAFFLYRVFRLAYRTRDDFTSFFLLMTIGLFASSILINIGMNLGLLPVTGITLPFISYGGSALVISFFLFGLVESVAIHDVSSKQK